MPNTKTNAPSSSSADTVILLSTDSPMALAIVRDLGRHGFGVVGIGRHATAIGGASRYCLHHAVAEDNEAALVAQIKALAAQHRASFLVAMIEVDLHFLNRHRAELEPALKILTPTADALAKVVDKAVCNTYAEQVGMRVPQTLQVASLDHARSAAAAVSYPVVLKWADFNAASEKLEAVGLEAKKCEYARTHEELIDRLAPYAALGEFPMIQQYCPGNGVGHTFLAKDGDILVEFQYERMHEWPPEGGTSSLCRAVPLSDQTELRAKSRALLKALRWTGVAMVEYRYDRAANTYWFLEVNGRFWGSLPLPIAAGVPFATALVAVCGQGRPVPHYDSDYPPITCRYLIPETLWLMRLLLQRSRIQDPLFKMPRGQALLSYVAEFFRPATRYYVFSLTDPKPFFVDAWNFAVNVLQRIRGRMAERSGPPFPRREGG